MNKIPKTNVQNQQARRKREKKWLLAHGFKSWEALHTKLMRGEKVIQDSPPKSPAQSRSN